ncbi:magnesium transporter MRS2 homolog, mitochondrial [Poeciliopsis prolifica]|uniref:magnesium transporter MRS2 homolog, mitochondrial n=1 Tax=Poeciliopsis prolifica TaxID=188132 RepID=UPI00241368C2|nr:magnesium transporter MRS2 homolog, mitochondrial [Poeciliopsis prolifica]
MEVKLHRLLLFAGCMNSSRMASVRKRVFSSFCPRFAESQTLILFNGPTVTHQLGQAGSRKAGLLSRSCGDIDSTSTCYQRPVLLRSLHRGCQSAGPTKDILLRGGAAWPVSSARSRVTDAPLSTVSPTFNVMKFDLEGNVTSFEKKKTELCQELQLQARDLRFQHSTSFSTRNNCIIIRMGSLKVILTQESLLVLDYRGLSLERWLVLELGPQLASQTHSLPFEFRALEAILQHKVNTLKTWLDDVKPSILDTLESLVDPKIVSADRSKLHILLQSSKSLSELETDIKVFKESLLKILDEDAMIEQLCLTKWTDPRIFEDSNLAIDHCEEMEHLLENYYMQAEELANKTRELKGLIDDSESVIFINLDSHRNVMMRLNLQLTMGSFSLTLFGLIGVAFGMNLTTAFEDDPRAFWLVTGFMFLGSGLIWRRLLSFLGRHLHPSAIQRNIKPQDTKPGVR